MTSGEQEDKAIPKRWDLKDKTFGRWTVSSYSHTGKHGRVWNCMCECGTKGQVTTGSLNSGNSKSCGCYGRDAIAQRNKDNRVYRTTKEWDLKERLRLMIQRCHKEYSDCYHNYGGRGIKVCDEWRDKDNGFNSFYKWSLENGYKKELTIDRINNDDDYTPENCRWVTTKKQANNRRSNVYVEVDGETHTIAEWAKIKGLERKTLEWRVRKGWEKEKLFIPPRKCKGINY